MLVGSSAIGIFMYSNQSSGVSRFMFIILGPAKRAFLVLMTLFRKIMEETMSTVHVVSSKGKSVKLPPTVMQTELESSFWG
jgi:hypothetical protein